MLAQLKRAMELQIAGKLAEAEAIYLALHAETPDDPDTNHLLGLVRSEQDRNGEAVAFIEKAIALRPEAAPFHHNIAGIYRRLGRLDDAEARFRTAIELKPDYGEAYQGLAEMVTFQQADPFLARVLEQLRSPVLNDSSRCYFHFAAGKYLDDVGEYATAFSHYQQGNHAAHRRFDNKEFRQQVKDTLYAFGGAVASRAAAGGNQSELPVFIVGMPRSGTTLVEQILASHSGVYGAGELNDMKFIARLAPQLSRVQKPYPHCMAGLSPAALDRLGDEYLKRLAAVVPGRFDRVVDKHPLNFQFVGLILTMFPRARVIHTVRHPLDTCLSCFFQNFTKGQHYSFDLPSLAGFYNDYVRLMEHWESLFPGRILTVSYERMLSHQREETVRLLDFCGLSFEPACLEFHKTDRVVKTASFLQVRRPLYHSSVGRWRNYHEQLRAFADMIGVPVEEPITISSMGSGKGVSVLF